MSRSGEVAAQAYLLTREQVCDVVAQETRREAGAVSELEAPLGGTGWYDALVTDVLHGHPLVALAATDPPPPNAPGATYLAMLVRGLRATRGWSAEECADYVLRWPGAESWTREDVLGTWRATPRGSWLDGRSSARRTATAGLRHPEQPVEQVAAAVAQAAVEELVGDPGPQRRHQRGRLQGQLPVDERVLDVDHGRRGHVDVGQHARVEQPRPLLVGEQAAPPRRTGAGPGSSSKCQGKRCSPVSSSESSAAKSSGCTRAADQPVATPSA